MRNTPPSRFQSDWGTVLALKVDFLYRLDEQAPLYPNDLGLIQWRFLGTTFRIFFTMDTTTPVTLRDIARECGVSAMTVSRALRDQPNLSPRTRERVRKTAEKLGYRPNPLVSALMAYQRETRKRAGELTLGFVTNFKSRRGWRDFDIYVEYFNGACARAKQQGYKLEEFWLGESGMTSQRMSDILYHRGITGLLLAPLPVGAGHMRLNWERFSTVILGYSVVWPQLHRAVVHHFRCMRKVVRILLRNGYQRLGLALQSNVHERVDHHWVGGFLSEVERIPRRDRIPHLILSDQEWNEERFLKWLNKYQPEVIISQHEELIQWIKRQGLRVPEDVGFVQLNCPDQSGKYAGIYQNGMEVGATAIDFLAGMMHRNERGIPPLAHTILIDGTWMDGKTLLLKHRTSSKRVKVYRD